VRRFRSLPELLKERERLRRWAKGDEMPSALVQEGVISPKEHADTVQMVREMLADVEQEIAERTSQNGPGEPSI
jgi:hypothetical protein